MDVAAPLVVGDGQGLVVGARPAEVDLEAGRAASSGVAVGVEDAAQGVQRLVDRDEAVGPVGVPRSGLGGHCGPDERRDALGEGPQPAAVHRDEAVVVDLLTGEEPADDVDALAKAVVAHLLARPLPSGDALVARLARPQGGPEATGEHARQGRDALGDDRGVVALPGGVDDPEGQVGGGERGPEEGPREPRLPLALRPRREVVRAHRRGEPGALGVLDVAQQPPRGDLFVRAVESDDRHARPRNSSPAPESTRRRSSAQVGGPGSR